MITRLFLTVFACWLALASGPNANAATNVVWIETESFDDYGGWTNDAQFVDQMGSPSGFTRDGCLRNTGLQREP